MKNDVKTSKNVQPTFIIDSYYYFFFSFNNICINIFGIYFIISCLSSRLTAKVYLLLHLLILQHAVSLQPYLYQPRRYA